MLVLWTRDLAQLKTFDQCIRDIIWSGQQQRKKPRVDNKTIKKALEEGGLNLISILEHTSAMTAKFMLWVV